MNTNPVTQARRQRQLGVGMIEVLVSILVVAVGFLGMSALQMKALSTNNSAMARSMATVASYSIIDAMRTDLNAVEAGAYNGSVTTEQCKVDATGLAATQIKTWCTDLGAALGVGSETAGSIDCSNIGVCTITIQFDDSRAADAGSKTQKVVTRAAL